MNKRTFRSGLIMALASLLLPASVFATPIEVFTNTVPDFYQHQIGIFPPGGDNGCCYVTAFLDELYYLSKKNSAPKLYEEKNGPNWVANMVDNTKKVLDALKTGSTFQDYLNRVDPGRGQWTVGVDDKSFFNNYTDWFSRGDGVLIYIEEGSGNFWWGFHVLAAAGYKKVKDQNGQDMLQLYFADPDTTKYAIDANHPDSNFCDNVGPSPCIRTGDYYWNNNPPPPSDEFPWMGPIGNYDSSYYQSCIIDANGNVQVSATDQCLYDGAQVTKLFDIRFIPEPATVLLLAVGPLVMGICNCSRQGHNGDATQ